MNRIILISALCMQFGWISCAPNPAGIGAYAYQDSDGNRYGGTYGLKDDQVNHGDFNPVPFPPDFDDFFPEYFRNFENLLQDVQFLYPISSDTLPLSPLKPLIPFRPIIPLEPWIPLLPEQPLQPLVPLQPLQPLQPLKPLQPLRTLQPLSPLRPLRRIQYLHPLPLQSSPLPVLLLRLSPFHPLPFLHSLLNAAFKSNKEYQKKALDSAKKAYDITSNQAGFMNFDFSRFPFNGGFGNFGMPNFGPQNFGPQAFGGQNSAFASGSALPGYSHQIAAISPANPNQPNVDIKSRFGEEAGNTGNAGNGGYMSVSSSSYAQSSNVNGQEQSRRGAETVVNNNGVVRRYKVES